MVDKSQKQTEGALEIETCIDILSIVYSSVYAPKEEIGFSP
jgi:hypothetical protein